MKLTSFWTIPRSPFFKMSLMILPALLAIVTEEETSLGSTAPGEAMFTHLK